MNAPTAVPGIEEAAPQDPKETKRKLSGGRLTIRIVLIAVLVGMLIQLAWTVAADLQAMDVPSCDRLLGWRTPHGEWQIVGDVQAGGEGDRLLVASPGKGVLVNGATGRTSNLLSRMEHGDVTAHIEFLVPKGSNSGIYFQARYEIQVLDSWGVEDLKHGDCGGIYQRWKDGKGYEGHAPSVNASLPPGEWQTFDIEFRAPRFDASGRKIENAKFVKVVLNGKVLHENVEVTGPTRAATFNDEQPTGPLMLQGDHGPVAYRNIQIKSKETQAQE